MRVQIRAFASNVAGRSKVVIQAALILVAIGGLAQAGTSLPLATIAPGVPEIDAGSAASALTLLVGGALLLKEKLSSRKADR